MNHSIKAITNDSVHRLHAGQVVLELQGAIKELVENSLDAGASSIDVRIKDHGLESIEISDNGSGIGEADWPYIGAKHHTSKLPALSALPHVTTFGFRGEALSSLCALCESVTITTSTKETAPMGTIVKLSKDGRVLDASTKIARPRGTTVLLTGLFTPLPVRRKEFERTVKREFTKALTQLYAYALVPSCASPMDGRPGVRLKVEGLSSGKASKRTTLIATDGRGSLRSSVSSVWGHKALEGVLDIDLDLEVEIDQLMARREGITDRIQHIKVSGLISTAVWPQGRSSPDRQFYYINGRPCDLRQISKAVNEVYKSFNTHQVPLAVLDFQIPRESVDINVSPDKRTIFLHSEANLINALRAALETFWMPSRSAYTVQDITKPTQSTRKLSLGVTNGGASPEDDEDDSKTEEDEAEQPDTNVDSMEDERMGVDEDISAADPSRLGSSRSSRSEIIRLDEEEEGEDPVGPSQISAHLKPSPATPLNHSTSSSSSIRRITLSQARIPIERTMKTTNASWSPDRKGKGKAVIQGQSARVNLRERLKGFASQGEIVRDDAEVGEDEEEKEDQDGNVEAEVETEEDGDEILIDQVDGEGSDTAEGIGQGDMPNELGIRNEDVIPDLSPSESRYASNRSSSIGLRQRKGPVFDDELEDEVEDKRADVQDSPSLALGKRAASPTSSDIDLPGSFPSLESRSAGPSRRKSSSYRDEIPTTNPSGEITLSFDLPRLRQRYATKSQNQTPDPSRPRTLQSALSEGTLSSAAGIGNRDATIAEEALSRVIRKSDFEKMEVLGQFNKGFIIARLRGEGKDDLFIVDQHASDEKFNFETLQRTTVIKAQTLIKPRAMQLTAGDEIVAMENLDILRANGFEVDVDEDQLPGRGERVKLVAMPVSKETVFDFKDLEQLLHLLGDGARPAGQMVRCGKARSMFAMRACRKSVMIGKALTKGQMVQLLRSMGTIDQPWNCPHGRPTMRHLVKLEKPRKVLGRIDWGKWVAAE